MQPADEAMTVGSVLRWLLADRQLEPRDWIATLVDPPVGEADLGQMVDLLEPEKWQALFGRLEQQEPELLRRLREDPLTAAEHDGYLEWAVAGVKGFLADYEQALQQEREAAAAGVAPTVGELVAVVTDGALSPQVQQVVEPVAGLSVDALPVEMWAEILSKLSGPQMGKILTLPGFADREGLHDALRQRGPFSFTEQGGFHHVYTHDTLAAALIPRASITHLAVHGALTPSDQAAVTAALNNGTLQHLALHDGARLPTVTGGEVYVYGGGSVTTVTGGWVRVYLGGTIATVNGGKVDVYRGTVTTVADGQVTIHWGMVATVTDGRVAVYGGTVTTVNGGDVHVEGGTVTTVNKGDVAVYGGTVTTVNGGRNYVKGSGKITTVTDGELTVREGGAATAIWGGETTVDGGTAGVYGGRVQIDRGRVTLYGGTTQLREYFRLEEKHTPEGVVFTSADNSVEITCVHGRSYTLLKPDGSVMRTALRPPIPPPPQLQ